ncbi:MAG: hypothetical protein LBG59_08950 [Candidatus Peribacteria bacterium]|nr:hypothetical protein [Candidatus Peribacteria bacterium]
MNANGIQSVNGLTTDETEESGAFTATEYSFTSFIHAVWKKINRLFYKKLDKKTTSGDYVYTHNGTTQNEKPYTIAPTASTLAERTNTGTLRGATAVQDTDLVNLGQFNSGLAEKADKNDIRFRDGTNNSYSYPQ